MQKVIDKLELVYARLEEATRHSLVVYSTKLSPWDSDWNYSLFLLACRRPIDVLGLLLQDLRSDYKKLTLIQRQELVFLELYTEAEEVNHSRGVADILTNLEPELDYYYSHLDYVSAIPYSARSVILTELHLCIEYIKELEKNKHYKKP